MRRTQLTLLTTLCCFSSFLFSAEECFLPSARPEAPKGCNLFAWADWLYWQPSETGLSYAIYNEDLDLSSDTLMGSGHVAQPKFDWNSGIRLGLGYNLPHDQWDLTFLWTWYEGTGDGSEQSDKKNTPAILPSFVHPNAYNDQSIVAALSANADISIHLNMLDLDLGKQVKLSQSVSLKPSLGLRSAWVNQTYSIEYQNLFDKTAERVLNDYRTHINNDFWGIGIFGGFSSDWSLKWGLSLFGEGDLSLLYGFFDNSYEESFVTPKGNGNIVISDTNNFHTGRVIADLTLGLRWTTLCLKERLKVILQTGWEQHVFFSQNQILRFVDGQAWGSFVQNQGDLNFQGFSIGLHLYF